MLSTDVARTLDADVEALRSSILGSVLLPGDPGYDEARSLWNGFPR